MAVQPRGPHVRELFVKNSSNPMTSLGAFEYEQKESKGNYDIKKKRRAPPPPTGLGQYKPKILSDDSLGNVPANRNSEESTSTAPTRPPRRSSGSQHQNGNAGNSGQVRALVMGDKDTPMVLHPSGDDAMEVDADDDESLLLRSDVVAVHEGGTETDNPLFNMRQDSIEEAEQTQEPEGVFIPAPDYDEEEKTIELTDEPEEDFDPSPRRGKKVYKEYAGEDFSQYLSDDETDPRVELRRPPRRPMHIMERKSKTEAKRPHYKKRESIPPKVKQDGRKAFSGSASLREFSYADSKFGTLKNGNDKKRHSLGSLAQDGEAELFVNTGTSSYEAFLRTRNGEVMTDLSSDSGFETGEERGGHPAGLPARYSRHSQSGKDTLWKKLTWKFKKHMHSFDFDSK